MTDAQRLRERVLNAIPKSDTEWPGDNAVTTAILAAIVEELGITEEMIQRGSVIIEGLLGYGHPDSAGDAMLAYRALCTLLDASKGEE